MIEDKKVHKAWRTIAIVCILIILLFLYLMYSGMKQLSEEAEQEKECVLDTCSEDIYTSYYYDETTEVCTCYDSEGGTITKYLG